MPALEEKYLRLTPRYLDMLMRMIHEYLPYAEVWAYGSRVNGDGHEASDLDIVVRNPEAYDRPVPDFARFMEGLMESDLPIRVDVLDWARIPETFRRGEIEQKYVPLT
ncbi:MAG: nucleotidyltransferase domain-containing protein [candidate division Zixibacteria bacterium]|nr:nucleotidyltransferase domain-containing protein [candidate division Zixibacteria bacterium]